MGGATAWTGLVGRPGYVSGVSGTPDIPSGAILISIFATAAAGGGGGSVVLFGGESIPVPAGSFFEVDFKHALWTVQGPNNVADGQVAFTGTTSYFVQYVFPTG